MSKKDRAVVATRTAPDPLGLLREFATELKCAFDRPFSAFRWPALRAFDAAGAAWVPEIEVCERDNRLVTKVDLPGIRKEDVKVEACPAGCSGCLAADRCRSGSPRCRAP